MLYKSPGKHEIHGGMYDYIIVDASDIGKYLGEGWSKTTPEALDRSEAKQPKKAKIEK